MLARSSKAKSSLAKIRTTKIYKKRKNVKRSSRKSFIEDRLNATCSAGAQNLKGCSHTEMEPVINVATNLKHVKDQKTKRKK